MAHCLTGDLGIDIRGPESLVGGEEMDGGKGDYHKTICQR